MRTASARFFAAAIFVIGSLAQAASANATPAESTSHPAARNQAVPSATEMVVANPGGKAAVTAIIDYQGHPLHPMRDQLSAFTKENPDIALVIKPWASGGPLSRFAAKAAYAAAKQGKLSEFHAAMLSDLGPHTWYSLRNAAPAFGLDWKRFEADFSNEALDRQVEEDARSIAALKITNSPAFVAGGRVFNDPWDKINFAQIAEAARHTKGAGAAAARAQ
ncbi:MAG: DsbA family protein [Rhodospirillaceae bacterium]|nr:DsbA family protein [Rhodospirillaceae bacterium]